MNAYRTPPTVLPSLEWPMAEFLSIADDIGMSRIERAFLPVRDIEVSYPALASALDSAFSQTMARQRAERAPMPSFASGPPIRAPFDGVPIRLPRVPQESR